MNCPRCGALLVEDTDGSAWWLVCTDCGSDYDFDDAHVYDEEEAA